jgi:hypothetical protein
MTAGRPRIVDAESLYGMAQEFYWDLRHLAEGSSRWRRDENKYKRLVEVLENAAPVADDKDRANCKRVVDYEIQAGYLELARSQERLREIQQAEFSGRLEMFRNMARADAREELKILGEPEVLRGLLRAKTAERIREICKDAFVPRTFEVEPGVFKTWSVSNWPIAFGSMLPTCLAEFAGEFVAAKGDLRYPRSTRPTNRLKQLWFLSRALAGAVFGVKTRTAINLVGSMRPEQVFVESRAAKPKRKRRQGRNRP